MLPAAHDVFDRVASQAIAPARSQHPIRFALGPGSGPSSPEDPVLEVSEGDLSVVLARVANSLAPRCAPRRSTRPSREILLSGAVGPAVQLLCLGMGLGLGLRLDPGSGADPGPVAWLLDPEAAAGAALWARPTVGVLTAAEVAELRAGWDRAAARQSRLRALLIAESGSADGVDSLWPDAPVPVLSLEGLLAASLAEPVDQEPAVEREGAATERLRPGDAAVRQFLAVLRQDRW